MHNAPKTFECLSSKGLIFTKPKKKFKTNYGSLSHGNCKFLVHQNKQGIITFVYTISIRKKEINPWNSVKWLFFICEYFCNKHVIITFVYAILIKKKRNKFLEFGEMIIVYLGLFLK